MNNKEKKKKKGRPRKSDFGRDKRGKFSEIAKQVKTIYVPVPVLPMIQ